MSRGKKHSPETIYAVMASYAITGNYAETAKALDLAPNTVKGIYLKNKGKKEFAQLLDKNKEEFATKATEIINKTIKLLNKRLDGAIKHEETIDKIIDEIASDGEVNDRLKAKLIGELAKKQMQSASDLARTMAIVFDKRALAKGDSTDNIEITIGVEEN